MMGFPYVEDGVVKVHYIRLKFGDSVLFPTTTFHFGVSNLQFCGHEVAPMRRRVFWYFDAMGSAADEVGAVLGPNEVRGIPKDYDLHTAERSPRGAKGDVVVPLLA